MTDELFRDDAYLRDCEAVVTAVGEASIELDRTVFYPLGGGQPGDTGTLVRANGERIAIEDTRKSQPSGNIQHLLAEGIVFPSVGEAVRVEIDWNRRYRHMRFHTSLHLLCALIDAPVTGGSIGAEKARLDFDLPEQSPDKVALTTRINALVSENHPVTSRWITDAQMSSQPELVRTMSVRPPGGQGRVRLIEIPSVDLQPCGGTHVRKTGEVGSLAVRKIEKKGRQNRRVILVFDE